jgi:hypothetical protein
MHVHAKSWYQCLVSLSLCLSRSSLLSFFALFFSCLSRKANVPSPAAAAAACGCVCLFLAFSLVLFIFSLCMCVLVSTGLYLLLPVMRINLQVLAGSGGMIVLWFNRVYLETLELNPRTSIFDQRKSQLHHFTIGRRFLVSGIQW